MLVGCWVVVVVVVGVDVGKTPFIHSSITTGLSAMVYSHSLVKLLGTVKR
jgi:hypothetical protein